MRAVSVCFSFLWKRLAMAFLRRVIHRGGVRRTALKQGAEVELWIVRLARKRGQEICPF